MKINLEGAGKKYYREWIFRNVNVSFSAGDKTVILGQNGSGKSTLLQVIGGAIIPNEGTIKYSTGEKDISPDHYFRHISIASPYLELIDEFTLREIIDFHFRFKSVISSLTTADVLKLTGLASKSDQVFRYFSSGMKQRVKLALALLSDTEVTLLDEPCSNLDAEGVNWYNDLVSQYSGNRIIIVASNLNADEYGFCTRKLNMHEYKS